MHKTHFHIYLSMILLASSVNVTAQSKRPVIRKVEIRGNTRLNDRLLLETIGIRRGGILPADWPKAAVEKLVFLYHGRGFYLARIDSVRMHVSPDSGAVDLSFWLDEGEPIRVGRVEIVGVEESRLREMDALLETRSGNIFDEIILEQDVERILVFLENRGHPLGRVGIESLDFRMEDGHPKMDVILRIEEGPFVTFGAVRIEGNALTKERVILREIRLKPGSPYRHEDVVSVRQKLMALGYFKEAAEPEVNFMGNRAVVRIKITEGNANTLDGVVGYTPPKSERERGYFTGRLEFSFKNLLGTGRFLEAYWEKKDAFSQAMRFGYEEPWLMGWPLHLGGRYRQEIRDTTYVERDWRFSIRYVPWPSLSLALEGGRKEILPDSSGSVLHRLAQTRSWFFALGIDYNTLDDPLNPRKGVRYRTSLTAGRKRNIGPEFLTTQEGWRRTVSSRRVEVDAEAVLPTFGRQVFYAGLHGIEVKTGDAFIPLSDQVRFGGARTLRGYTEDAFRGTLVAWVNCEYRYLISRRSRAFLFVDGGMYQRREEALGFVRGTKIGYGFGIRLETRLGLVGVDFGLGEGDSLMRGKVHVGLVNWF